MKKRILVLLSVLSLSAIGFAYEPVWTASHTATADSTKPLCLSQSYVVNGTTITTGGRGILHSVCVNDGPGGTITVYNSSSTAANTLAVIRSTSAINTGCMLYDVAASSGLVYTTSNPNDVTFTYTCY